MTNQSNLHNARGRIFRSVKALAYRMQPLSHRLHKRQQGTVALVAKDIHLGLMAVAVILLAWPDFALVLRYIFSFRSIGASEFSGVLRRVHPGVCISKEEFLEYAHDAIRMLESQQVKPESHRFLIQAALDDRDEGLASDSYIW